MARVNDTSMLSTDHYDDDGHDESPLLNDSDSGVVKRPRSVFYNYYVLSLLVLAFVSNQIDRLVINFIKEEIQEDIEFTDTQYGFLVGYGFAVVVVLCGIPLGSLADRYSRKNLLIFGIIMWSASTVTQGLAKEYWHLLVSRIGLGIGEATFSPAAIALIADYFEPEHRAMPDSLFQMGSYLGAGLASILSAVLISVDSLDWRWTMYIFGIFGFVLCFVIIVTLREPHRTRVKSSQVGLASRMIKHKSYSYRQTFFYMVTIDSSWRLSLAGGMRMLVTFSLAAFMPAFLKQTYPTFELNINYWYGLMTIVMGVLASLLGGALTTFWMRRNPRAPAFVSAAGCLLAIPFMAVATLAHTIVTDSEAEALTLAFACLFVAFGFSEVWPGPATLLLQSVLPQGMQGTGFGIYFAVVMLIGGAGPEVVALLLDRFDDEYAYVLLGVLAGGLFLSALLFLWSSVSYEADLLTREVFIVGGDMSASLSRKRRLLLYSGIALLLSGTVTVMVCTFLVTS